MPSGSMPTSASTCSPSPVTPMTWAVRTVPVRPRLARPGLDTLVRPATARLRPVLGQQRRGLPERRLKRFRHPSAGPLTFHSTSLLMADDPTIRIVILHPVTASDAAKLERLARS